MHQRTCSSSRRVALFLTLCVHGAIVISTAPLSGWKKHSASLIQTRGRKRERDPLTAAPAMLKIKGVSRYYFCPPGGLCGAQIRARPGAKMSLFAETKYTSWLPPLFRPRALSLTVRRPIARIWLRKQNASGINFPAHDDHYRRCGGMWVIFSLSQQGRSLDVSRNLLTNNESTLV